MFVFCFVLMIHESDFGFDSESRSYLDQTKQIEKPVNLDSLYCRLPWVLIMRLYLTFISSKRSSNKDMLIVFSLILSRLQIMLILKLIFAKSKLIVGGGGVVYTWILEGSPYIGIGTFGMFVGVEYQRIRMEFRMIAMSITWATADGSAGKSVHTWSKRATKKSIRRLIYDDGAMVAMNEMNSQPIPAFPYFLPICIGGITEAMIYCQLNFFLLLPFILFYSWQISDFNP